ncbi:hypothetical protein [aff. Roholtiella sp. LEGE 12411]|uniref:hypothetical protein n=1 Tax=aff. Roholtiella sp. LEGE 12411 TaxID=1828822 RepID=UPI00188234A2|nr:hypothetical protein [aff. Roholtiella sp. LEGE 12411]
MGIGDWALGIGHWANGRRKDSGIPLPLGQGPLDLWMENNFQCLSIHVAPLDTKS